MKRMIYFILSAVLLLPLSLLQAAEPFPGPKTNFNGATLCTVQIGGETAKVLCPEKPGPGKTWVLAPSLYNLDSMPVANITRTELELVKHGFHVVTFGLGNCFGSPDSIAKWDEVYKEMTDKYGLSKRVVLMGLSREGLSIARWAAANKGKVSCLYMDKAVCDFKSWPGGKLGISRGSANDWKSLIQLYHFKDEAEALAYNQNPVDLAGKLVDGNVAIIYVTGGKDDVVPYVENGAKMQLQYDKLGGTFKLIRQDEEGHHPHGLTDATPVVDFIQYHAYGIQEPTVKAMAYGSHPSQVLDFWKAVSDKPTPLAIYIHGGGWNGGGRFDSGQVNDFLKAGISVAAIEYRFIAEATADGIVPPVKGPLTDAARAIQFIRTKAGEWNFRKDRIATWGGSAGACSSLWLAFHKDLANPGSSDPVERESTRLYCVAAIVPQTTLDPQQMKDWTPNSNYGGHAFGFGSFKTFLEKRETILPWIAEYSPYALATADAPPVYMYFGSAPDLGKDQKDPTHTANFGVKLQEHLRELKVDCELVYPGAPDIKHRYAHEYLIDRLKTP